MTINKNTTALICELEYLVGKEVENCKFHNKYKYQVTVKTNKLYGTPVPNKTWGFTYPIDCKDESCDFGTCEELLASMCYVFGNNKLLIGKALVNVINYLETRYSLDFADLEEQLDITD